MFENQENLNHRPIQASRVHKCRSTIAQMASTGEDGRDGVCLECRSLCVLTSHPAQDGLTTLMHAAFAGDVDRVAALLESGADPNTAELRMGVCAALSCITLLHALAV